MDNPVLSRKVYFEKYIRPRPQSSSISSAPAPQFAGGDFVPSVGAGGQQDPGSTEEGEVGHGVGGPGDQGIAAHPAPPPGGAHPQPGSSSGSSTAVRVQSVQGDPPPPSPTAAGGDPPRTHTLPSPVAFHTPRSRLSASSNEDHSVATVITPTPSPSNVSLEWDFEEDQGGGALPQHLPAQAEALGDDQPESRPQLPLPGSSSSQADLMNVRLGAYVQHIEDLQEHARPGPSHAGGRAAIAGAPADTGGQAGARVPPAVGASAGPSRAGARPAPRAAPPSSSPQAPSRGGRSAARRTAPRAPSAATRSSRRRQGLPPQ